MCFELCVFKHFRFTSFLPAKSQTHESPALAMTPQQDYRCAPLRSASFPFALIKTRNYVVDSRSHFKDLLVLYLMCMRFCLHVFKCTACMPGAMEARREHHLPLELELCVVVSHHVDAGT